MRPIMMSGPVLAAPQTYEARAGLQFMALNRTKLLAVTTRSMVGLLVLLFAVALSSYMFQTRPGPAITSATNHARRVLVLTAQPVPVQRQWRGFGTANAMNSANVPARVTATVVEVPERILAGAHIDIGQVLARLDASDFTRQVEIATEAVAGIAALLEQLDIERQTLAQRHALETEDVQLAQDELHRVKKLFEQHAANQRDTDQAQRGVLAARRTLSLTDQAIQIVEPRRRQLETQLAAQLSNLRLAKQNLERCTIMSPLDGVVQSVDVELGENVVSGQRVVRVVNLNRIEVALRLPAAARSEVGTGNAVNLESTNSPERKWSSQIARIAPENDQDTRTFAVYVEVNQSTPVDGTSVMLAPGNFVVGTVVVGQMSQRYVVPKRSFQGSWVLLVEDGRLVSREVQVDYLVEQSFPRFGLPDLHWAVLGSTLASGDLVVVDPYSSLADGQIVEPVLPASLQSTAMRVESP